ncbi:hypothetical protein BX616_002207, partial [Lobosporangium transversale]
ASSSQRNTNYTVYQRARPMEANVQYRHHHRHSTVIYGSREGPREVEHPCCTLGRLCLQALTGVRR